MTTAFSPLQSVFKNFFIRNHSLNNPFLLDFRNYSIQFNPRKLIYLFSSLSKAENFKARKDSSEHFPYSTTTIQFDLLVSRKFVSLLICGASSNLWKFIGTSHVVSSWTIQVNFCHRCLCTQIQFLIRKWILV